MPENQASPAVVSRSSLRALMPTTLVDKIKAAAVEIMGERREVTVLFLDIANFTATAHALDSEEIYLLTDEAMRLLAAVIYEYEGHIDKYTGDGLMALFGAPVAHENDPERAVRAALEMQAALQPLRKRIQERHGLEFQTRIGINTGPVIAGRVGSDLHMEYTVIGDTVNLADRLQDAAEGGGVLVSFSTFQRTRPLFRYETLAPFPVKGKPQLVRAFRPVGLRARPGRVRGLPGLQAPMIGRRDALAQMRNTLAYVRQHEHSQIALVTGEAGVGKSRLVAEFLKSVAKTDVSAYQGSCLTFARSKPFWLVASLLRGILDLSETDPAEEQHEALRRYLNQMELPGDEVLPYLLNALGLERTDPTVETNLRHIDNATLQKLTHVALHEVLLAETRLAPTILVFEDLHWVDPASRDFLEHLIRTIDGAPLMLILVSRDAERETVIQPLIVAAEKYHQRLVDIHLGPLSEVEGRQLVDQLLKQTTDEAQALKRRIVERAEGNPFYAEEIIRMLVDQGGLTGDDGFYQVTLQAKNLVEEVPGTLNGLILARFDRLSEDLRWTLQRAAVLGASFPVGLLQSLNGADPDAVTAHLRELEDRHFLIVSRAESEPGYTFCHALIQEAVYGTLLKRDRQKLHEQAAHAIEESAYWLPEEQTEALAYHYAESGNPSKALPHLIGAAENAARRCAYETAIQHYRRALALMQVAKDDDQVVRVQIGLGQALKFVGEYAAASEILNKALNQLLGLSLAVRSTSLLPLLVRGLREFADIRVREGAPEEAIAYLQAGLDALGEEGDQAQPALWRSLIDLMAWVRFRQGKLEEAFALASSATLGLVLEQEEDPMTLGSLYNTLGGVLWQQGNLSEAVAYVERGLSLYESMGYLWGMANTCTNLGVLHFALGNWPKAAENLEQAEALQGQIGDIQNRAVTLNNLGILHQSMGEYESAQRELETSLVIRERLGDSWGIGQAHVSLAHLAVVQSRFADATAHVEAALRFSESIGSYEIEARWIWALCQAEDDLEKGIATAEQALEMARTAELAEVEADCERVLGMLRARDGDYLEAEVLLRESVDLCLQLDAPYSRGLALLELGRLFEKRAQADRSAKAQWREKALVALEEAIEGFESLGAVRDLQVARELRSQLQAEMAQEALLTESRVSQAEVTPARLTSAPPEGEWHTAAVVWLSLSPPPDADEEAVFETMALVLPGLQTIAREYHGQVIRRQDGLTVVFGAPTAYEDDAERAVQTARQMAGYLREPAHQTQVPLTFSVAVNQGDVVAGRIGTQFHSEFVVRGEPVTVAQRVAESVPAGVVWVTEAVRAATERLFVYEPAPPHVETPLAELSLWELTGLRERPAPARGLPGLGARLIGRDTPLKSMTDLSRNLYQGFGGLAWIEGEPGIGKSRLMREFAASFVDTDTLIWAGGCIPQRSGHALSLFSDLLAQVLGLQPTDTSDQIRAKIDQTIQAWPKDAQVTRPYLEMLLGLQPSGLHGERLATLEPEQLRQQTFVAFRRLFKSMANKQPMVIMLDDLHWVDSMSVELMQFLLTMVASSPILFVCAQRRQGADLPNERLVRLHSLIPTQTVRFCLERLSTPESETLLSELISQEALPNDLRTTILERSEGNPYFVEEFVRLLIEQGYLQQRQGRWELDTDLSLEDIPLPTSLETLIRSRVDALPAELKVVIQYAAVIGAPFEISLLESVSDLANVEAALRRLASRLLVRRGSEADHWVFNHVLIGSVTYNGMLKARREVIHLRVGQALEARWVGAEAEHADELAYHFARADEGAKALTYLVLAGERAAARSANEEAITYFEQAAHYLSAQPDAADRLRWRLAAGLGDVYRSGGRYVDSKAALEMGLALVETGRLGDDLAAGLYRRLGDTIQKQGELDVAQEQFKTAMTILGEPADRKAQTEAARTMTSLAWNYFLQGRFDQAQEACEASLVHARRADALSELAAAENLLGGVHYRQSEWKPALHHTRRAMVLREQMGYTWGVAATLSNQGILAVSAGDWNKAKTFFERSLALRGELGDVEGVVIVHNNLGTLTRDQGDLDLAEHHFKASVAQAESFKIDFHIANSTVGLAQVLLLKGEIEEAQEASDVALAQAEAIGAQDLLAETYCIQAEILRAQSAWGKALALLEQCVALTAETGNRDLEATAWRVASQVELQRGDLVAAREALVQAQEALTGATNELEAGRVAAQRGRISLQEGDLAGAEKQLRVAQEIFMRLGATLDLRQVEETLEGTVLRESDALLRRLESM
jgi:predicted ATPase/class 3 adenylate cyclase